MKWSGIEIVNSDTPSVRKNQQVNICGFRLVDDFVLFGLYRTNKDTLEFPKSTLDKASKVFGESLKATYVGYITNKDEVYAWYECKDETNYHAIFLNKDERVWWALPTEIVNWQRVLHFAVDESVVELFLKNAGMLYVVDDYDNPKPCVHVGYYGGYYTKMLQLALLGAFRSPAYASMGPYYYFGDYHAGMKFAFSPMSVEREMYQSGEKIVNDNGVFTRGGIARFALRFDTHNLLLGRKMDRSQHTKDGIKKGIVRKEDVGFRDSDGKWANMFDAIMLGRRVVKSRSRGENKQLHPQYVVRKFRQHTPLTYHYVDTSQNIEEAVIE